MTDKCRLVQGTAAELGDRRSRHGGVLLVKRQLDVSPSSQYVMLTVCRHQVIPRPTFDNDYLMIAYDREAPLQPHKVACVFFVLALGVLMDVDRPDGESMPETSGLSSC